MNNEAEGSARTRTGQETFSRRLFQHVHFHAPPPEGLLTTRKF